MLSIRCRHRHRSRSFGSSSSPFILSPFTFASCSFSSPLGPSSLYPFVESCRNFRRRFLSALEEFLDGQAVARFVVFRSRRYRERARYGARLEIDAKTITIELSYKFRRVGRSIGVQLSRSTSDCSLKQRSLFRSYLGRNDIGSSCSFSGTGSLWIGWFIGNYFRTFVAADSDRDEDS